jgi:hypothetical protein
VTSIGAWLRSIAPRPGTTQWPLALVFTADFDREVEAFARGILSNSWFSLRENKRLLIETEGMALEAGLAHEVFPR